ncbi:hypothetical protein ACLOJK_013357 [Asimina triloba]
MAAEFIGLVWQPTFGEAGKSKCQPDSHLGRQVESSNGLISVAENDRRWTVQFSGDKGHACSSDMRHPMRDDALSIRHGKRIPHGRLPAHDFIFVTESVRGPHSHHINRPCFVSSAIEYLGSTALSYQPSMLRLLCCDKISSSSSKLPFLVFNPSLATDELPNYCDCLRCSQSSSALQRTTKSLPTSPGRYEILRSSEKSPLFCFSGILLAAGSLFRMLLSQQQQSGGVSCILRPYFVVRSSEDLQSSLSTSRLDSASVEVGPSAHKWNESSRHFGVIFILVQCGIRCGMSASSAVVSESQIINGFDRLIESPALVLTDNRAVMTLPQVCVGIQHKIDLINGNKHDKDGVGDALFALRTSLNCPADKLADWNQNQVNPCTWTSVTCDANNYVVSLTLSSLGCPGTLSPSIGVLKTLTTLYVQQSSFYITLLFFGSQLAFNDLTGRIPDQLFQLPKYNIFDVGSLLAGGSRKSKIAIVFGTVGGVAGALLCSVVLFLLCKGKHKGYRREVFVDVAGEDDRRIAFGQLKRFAWRELQLATENFNEKNVLGQGGFGKVYKGVLPDNTKIAVKRLTDYESPGGEAAFLREVEMISFAVHKNLLRLIGFCTTPTERLLVYPFMQNLSVAYRLREVKPGEAVLDWPTRRRVALGTARGLEYLHEHCNPKIIHRDVKAANVLLDEDFEAVVGDFGLAKLVDVRKTNVTTQVRGTMGHIAPEYLSTGKSSERTDVFGYGIMLLELVTGQRAIDFSRLEEEDDVLLLDHVKKLEREKRLHAIVDRNLDRNYDSLEVEMMIQVALLCTQASPEDRPTMSEVVRMLEGEGLAERWEEWQQVEVTRRQEFERLQRRFDWGEDSVYNQDAIELSGGRIKQIRSAEITLSIVQPLLCANFEIPRRLWNSFKANRIYHVTEREADAIKLAHVRPLGPRRYGTAAPSAAGWTNLRGGSDRDEEDVVASDVVGKGKSCCSFHGQIPSRAPSVHPTARIRIP